ncbi:plastocyanin/azurin family copper-binding protein, partial [Accumulibacter sp.]
RGGLLWKFEQPGSVDFACLVPGHMEAGMVAKVTVSE